MWTAGCGGDTWWHVESPAELQALPECSPPVVRGALTAVSPTRACAARGPHACVLRGGLFVQLRSLIMAGQVASLRQHGHVSEHTSVARLRALLPARVLARARQGSVASP